MEIFLLVFFFYSGYFYKPGKKAITKSIADRSKALAVPFFKYSLVFWGIGSIYLVLTKNETVKEAPACAISISAVSGTASSRTGFIWNTIPSRKDIFILRISGF